MTDTALPAKFEGIVAFDPKGRKIGSLDYVYYDEINGKPKWALIGVGEGSDQRFAPLQYPIEIGGEGVQVSVPRDVVLGAPQPMKLGVADQAETNAIYDYYKPHIALTGDAARNPSRAANVDEDLERVMGMHVIHYADGSFDVLDAPPIPKADRDRPLTEAEEIIGERIIRLPDGSMDVFPDPQ